MPPEVLAEKSFPHAGIELVPHGVRKTPSLPNRLNSSRSIFSGFSRNSGL